MKTKRIIQIMLFAASFFAVTCCTKDGEEIGNSIGGSAGDTLSPSNLPQGAIGGKFTINEDGDEVYFSTGNLQFNAFKKTWRFATNQWDFVGGGHYEGNVYEDGIMCDNANISSTYNGWIDLFGWGTSGCHHGAICFQPWSVSTNYEDYYAYGIDTCSLNDLTGQADWGYNAISNGGNEMGVWRTLTGDEWSFILDGRITKMGIRYVKAQVNNVNGVILLPDDWDDYHYSFNGVNDSDIEYNSNALSASRWTTLEQEGAVFLPAAGIRYGEIASGGGVFGNYWSSSMALFQHHIPMNAYLMIFATGFGVGIDNLNIGHSVRLVQAVKNK